MEHRLAQSFATSMKKFIFALVVSWALVGLARAHIHSQKISGLKRSELSPTTWVCALISSALVGACGILPLLLSKCIRLESGCKNSLAFKVVLSFAVGGLLGDVFLHLLPEAYGAHLSVLSSTREAIKQRAYIGLWVVFGVVVFLAVEKMMLTRDEREDVEATSIPVGELGKQKNGSNVDIYSNGCRFETYGNTNSNCNSSSDVYFNGRRKLNGMCNSERKEHQITQFPNHSKNQRNTFAAQLSHIPGLSSLYSIFSSSSSWLDKDASGYLNLVANCTDNFTHGLAIAAGYVVGPAVGVLTTIAILCHEVPHEVGDFAILLNSGFTWKEAAKAQVFTACGGFVGVIVGLTAEHVASASSWLLPFTAGGFLYIALVSIVPDLLEVGREGEESRRTRWWRAAVAEVVAMGMGVVVMALVTIVEKKSCGHVPPHLLGT